MIVLFKLFMCMQSTQFNFYCLTSPLWTDTAYTTYKPHPATRERSFRSDVMPFSQSSPKFF